MLCQMKRNCLSTLEHAYLVAIEIIYKTSGKKITI